MAVEPIVRPGDERLVEPLLAATRLVPADEQDRLPIGVECEGDALDAIGGVAAQFLHVGMLRPGQGVRMGSPEHGSFPLEQQRPGEDRVLHLLWQGIEFRLECLGKGYCPRHRVNTALKLYSVEELILQERAAGR